MSRSKTGIKIKAPPVHYGLTWYGKTKCGIKCESLPYGMRSTTYKTVTCLKCLESLFSVKMGELKWIKSEINFQRERGQI
jgi:hypothetical protein